MKIRFILLAILVLASIFVFASCGETNDTETNTETTKEPVSNEIDYTVRVVNFKGEPVSSGMFVQILKDGEALGGMKKTNKDGDAIFTLEKGDYEFELFYTDEGILYDEQSCTLTEKKPSREIMLYNEPDERKMTISAYDPNADRYDYKANFINEGANKVSIDKQSYYLFQPKTGGVYKFGYICDVAITIGYFGQSGYVLESSTVEVKDRAFEIEVKNDNQYPIFVIGVKSLATDSCFLTVERVGEPTKEIQKIDYVATEVPKQACEYNYLNADIVDLDITNENLAVIYNENDGYYHLSNENGPIVLVRITTPSKYIASFTKMCETTKLFKIFKDENGTPLREEVYNDMIDKYAEKCDLSGVVPLTKELEYAIKNILVQQEWYGKQNIFKNPSTTDENGNVIEGVKVNVPEKNAWLFACCYLVENQKGTENSKILVDDTLDPTIYHVNIDGNETLYFKAQKNRSATLKIKNAQGLKVVVDGTEYVADESGAIEILLENQRVIELDKDGKEIETILPIEFKIANLSDEKIDVSFTYVTKI